MEYTEISADGGPVLQDEAVRKERAQIAKMSRLHGVHWFAVFMSLVLTTGAWYFTSLQVETQTTARFERYSNHVVELVQERLTRYEDALASGVAAVQAAGGDMSYPQWKEFTGQFQIETKYPGINGMGIIYQISRQDAERHIRKHKRFQPGFRIYPEHDNETLYPITYIEPAGENSIALGLDMAHETNRLTATLRARDTGLPQVTGPIVLVQDAQKTPGFLFFMPFYKDDRTGSLEERRENFVGMVYAPFIFNRLIEGILGKENRQVHFSLRDGAEILYSEEGEGDAGFEPGQTATRTVSAYGRTWTFEIWDTPEFQEANRSNEPIMILIGGLVIDVLLFSLFVLLANSNHRALRFADRMTEEAEKRAESLQRSNEDLERFAYVASHDLKTPLRGIGFLTECIRDDLELADDPGAESEVVENLDMLDDQVRHMDSLITGILAYSSVRTEPVEPKPVNSFTLIEEICASAGLRPEHYRLTGEAVDFHTDVIRLKQVLQNLVSNAQKYHPAPDELMVTVDVQIKQDRLAFTVSDNGNGIDARYHDKIFEMFQTLNAENIAGSTGIGLAIVKKTVSFYGGEVQLISEPGEGSRFSFDWPLALNSEENIQVAA